MRVEKNALFCSKVFKARGGRQGEMRLESECCFRTHENRRKKTSSEVRVEKECCVL